MATQGNIERAEIYNYFTPSIQPRCDTNNSLVVPKLKEVLKEHFPYSEEGAVVRNLISMYCKFLGKIFLIFLVLRVTKNLRKINQKRHDQVYGIFVSLNKLIILN